MKNLLFFALCFAISAVHAQYLMPELDQSAIVMAKEAYAVNLDGDTVRGKMGGAMLMNGQLKSFSIKSDDGKIKFKAPDVKLLAVKPGKLANLSSAMSTPNIQRAGEMDVDKIMNREWVFFEQALLPKAKDKYVMMQLLNSGFDSKIKVYLDPNAQKSMGVAVGGIQVAGNEAKSYLVVVNGEKSELYKKSSYDKVAMSELFTDCDAFNESYADGNLEWRDFAEHVFVYDQLCK